MKQGFFEIIENIALTDTVYKMTLKGDVSDITAPGQFVNIKLDGLYLRRPISVCDVQGICLPSSIRWWVRALRKWLP